MITPAGVECRFYYEDYYRGRETHECRLIARNRKSLPWKPKHCFRCPVPSILRANSDPNMALEARVVRRFHFWERVEVEAYCTRHLIPIPDPHSGCPQCRAERAGKSVFDLPVAPGDDDSRP